MEEYILANPEAVKNIILLIGIFMLVAGWFILLRKAFNGFCKTRTRNKPEDHG